MTIDRADRDRARFRLDANVVVEAGAGTGKTTLLTDRILFLLLGGKRAIPIASLVALTFTEKAAAEIKLRLADRLAELLQPDETRCPRARELLAELGRVFDAQPADVLPLARRALEDMDKAQIGTIHSFAAHLLRLYPVEAGVDPGFSVDEGHVFEELFASQWALWLDAELGEEPPRPRAWLDVLRLCPLDDLEALARELCREKVELEAVGEPDPAAAAWFEAAAEALASAGDGQPKPKGASKLPQSLAAVGAHLRALAAAAREKDPALPPLLTLEEFKASSWPRDWDQSLKPLYERACDAANASSPAREALTRAAARLLLPFAHSLRAAYARRGSISFDGLLRKARDLVRDHRAAREQIKARYAALLIDEFQDTDPLQGELLLFLAEKAGRAASRWQDIELGAGRLFVVGDPKQSIYRFRGADIAAYQRFTEKILAGKGAFSCELKANFRSPSALIDPVNAVFSRIMEHVPGLQAAYKPLTGAAPGKEDAAIELVLIGPARAAQAPQTAEAVQRAEASWISRWLLDNCGPKKKRRFRDAAVLLRSATPLPALLDAFKRSGIPYAVEMEKHFYGAPEIVDLLNLLRALDDPEDSVALAGLLRSPLAALPDAALYALAQSQGLDYRRPSGLRGSDGRRADALFGRLRELRALVGRAAVADVVREILGRTPLLELSAKAYHGEQTVSNLLKFSRLAAEASDARGLTLKEFVHDIAAQMDDGRAEGESPLADEHLEAVRVMTIHKSKGLEFPVVFFSNVSGGRAGEHKKELAALDWSTGRVGLRLSKAGAASATMAWLEGEEKARQDHEANRLLYVAMTRAKEKLFVLGKHEGAESSLSARLSRGGGWPAWDCDSDRFDLGGALVGARRVPVDADPSERRTDAYPAAGFSADIERLAALWSRRAEAAKAGPAAWTSAPTDYLRESGKEPRLEEGAAPRASLLGQVCHRVLERWDYAKRGDAAAEVDAVCASMRSLEPGVDWPAVRGEALAILAGFVDSPAARALAEVEILGREVPFVYGEDGVVLRGSIDLLYRDGGKVVVADYKTDHVTPQDLRARRDKYERQGRAYCAAVERALGLKGVEFRLLFLRRPELSGYSVDL